jgi:ankyrin repeat protein
MDALHIFIQAIEKGNTRTVNEMLHMDPTLVQCENEEGISVIQYAAYCKNQDIIDSLLENVSHLSLHEACSTGYLSEVKRNLKEGPDKLNTFSPDGFTALALACYFGYPDIVEYLLDEGADPDIRATDKSRVAPLNAAVASDRTEIVAMLLNAGADPNIQQKSGIAPIHSAAHNGNLDIIELLIKAGADISLKSDEGMTAIDYANERNHKNIIKLLSDQLD